MTMKEADEAAQRCLPVIHNGIEYKRITRVGYWYDEKGQKHCFVELHPTFGNCVLFVEPRHVTLKGATS